MNYTTIATQQHSDCDIAGIFQFKSTGLAKAAAAAINDSHWVSTKGRVQDGNTGAFQVGNCVVFNSYSEVAFDGISKLVNDLHAPDAEREALWFDLWASLTDENTPYPETRDLAIEYFTQLLPGATVDKVDDDKQFSIRYNGKKFIAQLEWDGGNTRIMVFVDHKGPIYDKPDFNICEVTADVKQTFDLHSNTNTVTPETPKEETETHKEKSLEERLDKVEHLITDLQREVSEIKKKL